MMLDWLFSPLPPGKPAPEFSLPDESGNTVSLSSLRGRNVVLVFYPGDDTMVCRKQLCEFRDGWDKARALNTAVFGVNPQDAASHRKFRDKFAFPFPLLVDSGKKVAGLYRAAGPIVRRTVYLIGPDGVIRSSRRGTPDPAEVLSFAAGAWAGL
jgi:thioredoxin-dependent peroxiredoxin